MAYCRKEGGIERESDLYVYPTHQKEIVCATCPLMKDAGAFVATSPKQMLQHVLFHKSQGHRVPKFAIERLEAECEKDFKKKI